MLNSIFTTIHTRGPGGEPLDRVGLRQGRHSQEVEVEIRRHRLRQRPVNSTSLDAPIGLVDHHAGRTHDEDGADEADPNVGGEGLDELLVVDDGDGDAGGVHDGGDVGLGRVVHDRALLMEHGQGSNPKFMGRICHLKQRIFAP